MRRRVFILIFVTILTVVVFATGASYEEKLDSVRFPFGIKIGMDVLDALRLIDGVVYEVTDDFGGTHSSVRIGSPVVFEGHEVGFIFDVNNENKRIEKITIVFDSLGGMIKRAGSIESIYSEYLNYILGIFGEPDATGGERTKITDSIWVNEVVKTLMSIRNRPMDRIWVNKIGDKTLSILLSGDPVNAIEFVSIQ